MENKSKSKPGYDLDLFSIDSIISPSQLVTDFIKNIIEHPGCSIIFLSLIHI